MNNRSLPLAVLTGLTFVLQTWGKLNVAGNR
jgi:hypothetical protein